MNPMAFKYTIKTNKRSRNLRLTIKSNGEVVITKPWLIPDIIAQQFIKSHKKWIENKLALLQTKKKSDKYLYQGILYDIVFDINKFSVKFTNNKLYLTAPEKSIALKTLEKHLINQGGKLIRQTTKLVAQKMDIEYGKITIRDQDSRWGSCSSKGNLNFSWRLIKAPQLVLEYVIIHELAHIKHMDHSKKFWQLVEIYDPEYREHRHWLKRNQNLMK